MESPEFGAAVLDALRRHVRPLVLQDFSADSCVTTTRITIDVLAYFGIDAKGASVEVVAWNAEAWALMRGGMTPDELGTVVRRYAHEDTTGPWTLGLGFDDGDPNGVGHVVTWIPVLNTLADFSIDQASRPRKGMTLEPLAIVDLDGSPLDSDWHTSIEVPQPDPYGPCVLLYQAAEPRFTRSPNWRGTSTLPGLGPSTFRAITGQVIRAVRDEVGAP